MLIVLRRIDDQTAQATLTASLNRISEELSDYHRLDKAMEDIDSPIVAAASLTSADGQVSRFGKALPNSISPGLVTFQKRDYLVTRVSTPDGVLMAAIARERDEAGLRRIGLALALLWLPLSAIVGAVAWLAAGRMTRELSDLGTQAATLRAGSAHIQLATPRDADVAELVRSLNELLGRIEDEITRQKRLVEDVAHDLRTPLTVIQGRLEMALGKTRTESEYRKAISAALAEAQRLERLSEATLTLALSTGHIEAVDLEAEVQEAGRRWESQFAEAAICLEVATEPVLVAGSAVLMSRFIDNLLDNARKNTPAGGRCRLSLRTLSGVAIIEVADSGPGIQPKDRQRVFERFSRGDLSRSRSIKGFGVGLAVCRETIESMGGTIRVDESEFGGARIVAEIPISGSA